MNKIVINGGKPLNGSVTISGMKNAALPIIFATVLIGDECFIDNIPCVDDILLSLEILREMGAEVEFTDLFHTVVRINTKNIKPCSSPDDLVKKIRGSYYLAGAELGRFGESAIALPGGCNFGERPIDQHEKAFRAIGAKVTNTSFDDDGIPNGEQNPRLICKAPNKLKGTTIMFDTVTVGATANAMIASVLAEGTTILEGAAREPHIVDLANFLNTCGARIVGAGTDTIKIHGVKELHGCNYSIIPDMIEAGTYMVAVAATGGKVRIENIIPKHLEIISSKLEETGVIIEEEDEALTVLSGRQTLHATNVLTKPYPGFPTDMHPQFGALFCTTEGTSQINETIYANRFKYVEELKKMGANIIVNGVNAYFKGPMKLHGAKVEAVDLRAGAALVIAGLVAEGQTVIDRVDRIDRGYNEIVQNLKKLGADIERQNFAERIFDED